MQKEIRAWIYTHTDTDDSSAQKSELELEGYVKQTDMTVVGRSMDVGDEPLVTRIGIGGITEAAGEQ